MENFLIGLGVIYCLIGLIVYVMIDVSNILDKVEWLVVVVSEDGTYRKYMFLFIVLFWPVALLLSMVSKKN